MGYVYVYAPDADEFTGMGLCGALTPSSCVHTEEANGMSELEIIHPIDDLGRWSFLRNDYLIKAPVPVRTTPPFRGDGALVTSVEHWTVKATATKTERCLYSKAVEGRKKNCLPVGTEVTVFERGERRYRCKTSKFGEGWIAIAALENAVMEVLADDPAAIEAARPSWKVREQLFRVYSYTVTETQVTANARHIFYDLLGNNTSYDAENPTAKQAAQGILSHCQIPHDFAVHTNIADTRAAIDWQRINPVEVLLDPEEGLCAKWGLELVRDDWDIYLLKRAGLNRGVRVEYAKNLLGVRCEIDRTDVVTRVIPVGATKSGKPLLLEGDAPWVDSADISRYATPRISVLDCSAEATVNDEGVTAELARARMRALAEAEFVDKAVDKPTVDMRVEFLDLGDTAEYAQYKCLEALFLYDNMTIVHKGLGIEALCEVTSAKFDCLLERFINLEVGTLGLNTARAKIAGFRLPANINGRKLALGTVSGGQLAAKSVSGEHIQNLAVGEAHIDAAHIRWAQIESLSAAMATIAIAQITTAHIDEAHIDWAQIESLTAAMATIAVAQITTAHIDQAHIDWAQIESLTAAMATIAVAQITTAHIDEAHIDWASIQSLTAAIAHIAQAGIGTASIGFAQIVDLLTNQAIITQGMAGQLYIRRLCVTEANMVSLTLGELLLKGPDGNFYRIGVDESGNVTAILVQVEGGNVANGTLSGSNLIEGTITARELNVGQIFADEALIEVISANNIAAGAIAAAHLSAAAITALEETLDLSANTSITQTIHADAAEIFAESAANVRGTRLVLSFSNGLYLTGQNPSTTVSAHIYRGNEDITDSVPLSRFVWTRVSADTEADAAWNSARTGFSSLVLTGADVDFHAVVACTIAGTLPARGFALDAAGDLRLSTDDEGDAFSLDGAALAVEADDPQAYTLARSGSLLETIDDIAGLTASATVVDREDDTYVGELSADISTKFIQTRDAFRWLLGGGTDVDIADADSYMQLGADGFSAFGANVDFSAGELIQMTVGGRQVGNVNLLANSGFENGDAGWTWKIARTEGMYFCNAWSGITPFRGAKLGYFSNYSGHAYCVGQFFPTTPGRKYAVSFYARGRQGEVRVGVDKPEGWLNIAEASGAWRRYAETFIATANTHDFVVRIPASNGEIFLDCLKVETGGKVTGWCPAPNELSSSILSFTEDGGLRLDRVMGSASPHYFQAGAGQFGLFRSGDGAAVAVGGVDADGKGYFSASQLRDAAVDANFHVDIHTFARGVFQGTGFRLMDGADCLGSVYGYHYDPNQMAMALSSDVVAFLGDELDFSVTGGALTAMHKADHIAPNGNLHNVPVFDVHMHIQPVADGSFDLGDPSHQWRRVYLSAAPIVSSDARYKTDVASLAGAEAFVYALKPRRYRRLGQGHDRLNMGFVAQEVKEALQSAAMPDMAVLDESNPESLALCYEQFLAPLVQTVQSQRARIDALEERLGRLEARFAKKETTL